MKHQACLAYVEPHLGAHHSPDVFHGQHELVKAVCGPMATKQRAAAKAASKAQERLAQEQEELLETEAAPTQRGAGHPSQAAASLEQLQQDAPATSQGASASAPSESRSPRASVTSARPTTLSI